MIQDTHGMPFSNRHAPRLSSRLLRSTSCRNRRKQKNSMARFHKNGPKHEGGVSQSVGSMPRREANEKTSRQRGSRPPPTFQRRDGPVQVQ
jgi:hypothetical protein